MPKEKKTTRKKGTQTVKALLQDSDRQVLRFNRLTPLPGIVCHLSAGRETAKLLSMSKGASLTGMCRLKNNNNNPKIKEILKH